MGSNLNLLQHLRKAERFFFENRWLGLLFTHSNVRETKRVIAMQFLHLDHLLRQQQVSYMRAGTIQGNNVVESTSRWFRFMHSKNFFCAGARERFFSFVPLSALGYSAAARILSLM